MRKILLTIVSPFFCFISVSATEWFAFEYHFPYFKFNAYQLLGSEDNCTEMFTTAAVLNTYVKKKIDNKELKNKPIIYTNGKAEEMYKRVDESTYEVFETKDAYIINSNSYHHFSSLLKADILIKIIDYFTHSNFKPLYVEEEEDFLKKVHSVVKKSVSFAELKKKVEVYSCAGLKIYYLNNAYRVYWNDKDLDIQLEYPISEPIKYHDRVVFLTDDHFYVFENGQNIKK